MVYGVSCFSVYCYEVTSKKLNTMELLWSYVFTNIFIFTCRLFLSCKKNKLVIYYDHSKESFLQLREDIPNFTWAEVVSGFQPDARFWDHMKKLQALRDWWNAPFKVSSGYRSEKHNEVIGGSIFAACDWLSCRQSWWNWFWRHWHLWCFYSSWFAR